MSSIASADTIQKLRMIFVTHGLQLKIVTDSGASFTSAEFLHFMEQNGIKHITSAPYHPSTNGQAELTVQTFKRAMECMKVFHPREIVQVLDDIRLTPHIILG